MSTAGAQQEGQDVEAAGARFAGMAGQPVFEDVPGESVADLAAAAHRPPGGKPTPPSVG